MSEVEYAPVMLVDGHPRIARHGREAPPIWIKKGYRCSACGSWVESHSVGKIPDGWHTVSAGKYGSFLVPERTDGKPHILEPLPKRKR